MREALELTITLRYRARATTRPGGRYPFSPNGLIELIFVLVGGRGTL